MPGKLAQVYEFVMYFLEGYFFCENSLRFNNLPIKMAQQLFSKGDSVPVSSARLFRRRIIAASISASCLMIFPLMAHAAASQPAGDGSIRPMLIADADDNSLPIPQRDDNDKPRPPMQENAPGGGGNPPPPAAAPPEAEGEPRGFPEIPPYDVKKLDLPPSPPDEKGNNGHNPPPPPRDELLS